MKLKSVDKDVKSLPWDDCFYIISILDSHDCVQTEVLNRVYQQTYTQILRRIKRDLYNETT